MMELNRAYATDEQWSTYVTLTSDAARSSAKIARWSHIWVSIFLLAMFASAALNLGQNPPVAWVIAVGLFGTWILGFVLYFNQNKADRLAVRNHVNTVHRDLERNTTFKNAQSLAFLMDALAASWSAETTSVKEIWTGVAPELGQSDVTALVVQDYFGGSIAQTVMPSGTVYNLPGEPISAAGVTHFYNILPSDGGLDLTSVQYSNFAIRTTDNIVDRNTLLAQEGVRERYESLVKSVASWMTDRTAPALIK